MVRVRVRVHQCVHVRLGELGPQTLEGFLQLGARVRVRVRVRGEG